MRSTLKSNGPGPAAPKLHRTSEWLNELFLESHGDWFKSAVIDPEMHIFKSYPSQQFEGAHTSQI